MTKESISKRISDPAWKELTKLIRKRDKNTCYKCNKKGLQIHHIIPFKFSKSDRPDNLITLCQSCHTKIDHEYSRTGKTNYIRQMINCAKVRNRRDE
ncbi:MAG: HNH endonuclease [Nanoarchaeota archaeon]|nr:HNH endonuclease [Nanoarchaeota archaeon]